MVESEIDTITLWQAGFPALALGGANLDPQAAGTVNTKPPGKAGRRIAQTLINEVSGFKTVLSIKIPDNVKDLTDMTRQELLKVIGEVKESGFFAAQEFPFIARKLI